MKKKKHEPCEKFRKELATFLKMKWTSASPVVVELLQKDVIMFFERYHKENKCFYE